MKKLILAIALLTAPSAFAQDQYVQGHYRSNGTYVQPYHRSKANDTVIDNYGYQLNSLNGVGSVNMGNHQPTYNNGYRR